MQKERLFLGIDLGSSGVKVILVNEKGNVASEGYCEQSINIPYPGWAEQDPNSWWKAVKIALRLAIDKITPSNIAAIGISAQMLGLTILDRDLQPIRPCVIWCDQRSAKERDAHEGDLGLSEILRLTGNYPLTGYWLPKLLWLYKNEPSNFEKIYKVIFPKDYIRYILTGNLSSEVSDNGGSGLFDVKQRRWSWELIDYYKFPRQWFPPVLESADVSGVLLPEIAEELGLPAGIPVAAGGGDQTCCGIGNGIIEEGLVSVNLGTSGVVFACTDKLEIDYNRRAVHSFCHSEQQKWAVFGCTLAAGGSFRWLRDNLALEEQQYARRMNLDPYDLMTLAASTAPVGSKSLLFLPYMIGERTPHPDPYASGAFLGLTIRHNRCDMIRSVMEGITFSLRDSIEMLREFQIDIKQVVASGGGSKSKMWRQMQADVFDTEVITTNISEGTATGAAILAAISAAAFSNTKEACEEMIRITEAVQPIPENSYKYNDLYGIYASLYDRLAPIFPKIFEYAFFKS